MKHHYPVRALSLLCALAIFVSLIPAALAAAPTAEQLENHIVKDTVTPAGIQINLFDYWVTSQTENDTGDSAQHNTGINKDHHLRFTNHESGAINAYTHSAAPCPKIVQNQLKDGYPVLTAGKSTGVSNLNNGQTTEESLAYLFDQSEETETNGVKGGTLGKKTYWDVGGLLRIDDDGYYYYNADHNKSKAVGGSYQSANYAYFDEGSKTFKVYDTWGIKKVGAGEQQGQFFPFTNPSTANVFTVDDSTGALKANESTNSKSNGVNHFFGVSMTTRFIQRYGGMTSQQSGKAMTFEFAGDDDVWIFIDGVLVADLGGIHDQASTKIDFSTGKIYINGNDTNETLKSKIDPTSTDTKAWDDQTFADNTYHTLKLFYLERGGTDSNLAMKFNLAYVPETDGIKVDQNGTLLPGVQFDLYAAKVNPNTSSSERYVIDKSKGASGLLATGTTDSGGRFVLNDDTGGHISLNELTDKHHVEYLILQEQPEGREGYRRDENIYLVLTSNGTVSILFNDMEHRWTTGTYAGLKGTVSTSESVQLINADRTNYVPGTAVTDEDGKTLIDKDGKAHLAAGGTLFAVIMRRLDNVGTSVPSDSDTWGVVTGSALSGWTVYERVTGQVGYRKAVINALKAGAADNGNAVAFELTTNGAYMAELKNCPGDLREYYYWTGNSDNKSNDADTAYSVAFFYTTGDLADASLDNTYPVDGSGFERQFAATIYIPNVKHYLNVQKVDETGTAVPKATFSLYEKDDLLVTDTTWSVIGSATPYDTVTTGTDGKAQFPSAGKGVLAEGQYYLVEDRAPAGYKVNATAVPILVDDKHGVMADAGTANDGVAVTVAEGHLVPTMTPFATVDDIDRTLTNITTTRMEAPSSSGWDPKLEKAGQTVDLMLDTESFKKDHPVQTLRYIPVDGKNKSLSWRTETGWLWFHIEQTPIADDDPDKNLKTNLGDRDLTRLFTGETTVIVTNQRVGTLAVSKTVENPKNATGLPEDYAVEIGLNDTNYSGTVNCTSKIGTADATNVTLNFASGKVTYHIQAGETLTLLDLPIGTKWTVCEGTLTNAERWDTKYKVNNVDVASASGKIKDTNQNDTVNITNTYVEPDPEDAVVENALNVRKQYAEGSSGYENVVTKFKIQSNTAGAPMPNPAEISITGQDTGSFGTLKFTKAGTYTYTVSEVKGGVNGMTYAETVYTVTFEVERGAGSDINKLVIKNGYPIYTVVEKPGATSKSYLYTDTTGLLFTNTYNPGSSEEQDKGSLSIHKTLENPKNATTGLPEKYEIKITLSHYDGISSSSQIGISEPQSVTLTFTGGEATYHIQAGETLTLTGLPVGTTWKVEETETLNSGNWKTTVTSTGGTVTDKVASGKIKDTNQNDTVDITNTYTPNGGEIVPSGTGALSISKEIGKGIDSDTTFDFLIEVNGASGSYDATRNGTASSVTFTTDGSAPVKLKGGETLLIKGLPAGVSYTVTETTTGYDVTYENATGKIVKDETVTCKVTNELKGSGGEEDPKPGTGSLRITKTVDNKTTEDLSGKSYAIEIVLKDAAGNPLNNTFSSCAFVNGKYTWSATDGATLTLTGLPVGTQWTVTEIESLDPEHWSTTVDGVTGTSATGTISEGITSTVTIVNTYKSSGGDDGPGPGPGPGPNPSGDDGGTPALNRRDHYAYIIGYPDGDVHPQGNITRAEVATIFFRLLRDPVRTQYWSQTNGYSDVAFNKWYNNAISTLSNMGIICGYPDGSFRPDAPITRAELTKIAASFFSDPRVATTYDGRFSDVQGAEWYISYLMTAIKEGLIEGYPDGSFRPDRPITRAETCTIVNRTLGRKPDKDHLLPESVMINWPDNLDRNVWYYAQMQEATNSHDYRWTSVYSEVCEQWTAKLIERDWAALERTWSHANSAPGGEVMQ